MSSDSDFVFVQIEGGYRIGSSLDSGPCSENDSPLGYISQNENPIVPSHYQGIEVIEIGKCAFINSQIKSISLPNTIKKLKSASFYQCTQLTSIIIPPFVDSIGVNAFFSCISLSTIKYCGSNNLQSGSSSAFTSVPASHVLVSINYPESLSTINQKTVSRTLTDCENHSSSISHLQHYHPSNVCSCYSNPYLSFFHIFCYIFSSIGGGLR